jgi:methyltransferase
MFEIQKNIFITFLLLAFAVATVVYRVRDVYLKSYGEKGNIYFRGTLHVLGFLHFLIGIFSVVEYLFLRADYNWLIGITAFLFFLLGQALRNWAIHSLGKFHSPHIEIKPKHQLITSPPYKYTRNPYYLGVMLEVLFTPLIFNAYFSLIFASLTYIPVLFLRIFLEEKILDENFGISFHEYKRLTPRFVPRFK